MPQVTRSYPRRAICSTGTGERLVEFKNHHRLQEEGQCLKGPWALQLSLLGEARREILQAGVLVVLTD